MKFTYLILGAVISVALAQTACAQELELSLPLDCVLGESCVIQQYVDHDTGPKAVDFACGSATYDGHKGTDFRLLNPQDMARGVTVMAAAPGVVLGLRDGMKDRRLVTSADRTAIKGRECGNGVVLDHGNGWKTRYCHMKKGSVQVLKGERVSRGAPLGLVGLSGKTQFPHLHITVNKNAEVIDPFQVQKVNECGINGSRSLWLAGFSANFTYQPTQVLQAGFAAEVVKYGAVQDGKYSDLSGLSRNKPLIAYGLVMNLQKGDQIRISLSGPKGKIAVSEGKAFDKNKAQWMSFTGKKPPRNGWLMGEYISEVSVLRVGKVISRRTSFYHMK